MKFEIVEVDPIASCMSGFPDERSFGRGSFQFETSELILEQKDVIGSASQESHLKKEPPV